MPPRPIPRPAASAPPRWARRAVAAAWVPALLAGCGGAPLPAEGFPAPGELQVIDIRPVAAEREGSLLPNGSFEDYYAGAFAPTGPYVHPAPDIGNSYIQRTDTRVAEGRFAVAQTWSASDWEDAVDDLFGALIEGLRPQTNYTFTAQADPGDGPGGTVMLYYVREGGGYEPFHEIEVAAGPGFKPLAATFNTGPYTRIRIATLGPWQEGAYPSTILWDDWRLARASEADADIGGVDYAGLVPNGHFAAWFAGSAAPSGGYVPPAESLSRLERATGAGDDGSYAALQRWTMKDWGVPLTACFGVQIRPVTPGAWHRLSATASAPGPGGGHLVAYAVTEGGEDPAPIAQINVAPGDDPREYDTIFQMNDAEALWIAARGPERPGQYPAEVRWENWTLEEIDAPAEAPPAATDDGSGGLLANGSFEIWYAGQLAPEGPFSAPNPLRAPSYLLRVDSSAGHGNQSVEQYWTGNDNALGTTSLFRAQVDDLEADTDYVFSFQANTLGEFSGRVVLYALDADGRVQGSLGSQGLRRAHGFQSYSIAFNAGAAASVLIVTKGPGEGEPFPNRVIWDDWRLNRK